MSSNQISEQGRALIIAAAVLDRPNADPDDDIAVLARQLNRRHEEANNLYQMLSDYNKLAGEYDCLPGERRLEWFERQLSELDRLRTVIFETRWRPGEQAPKDGTPFLAWCPVTLNAGDANETPDAEIRVVWWEARGQFTSDRDLGNEQFTHWRPLPPPPLTNLCEGPLE